MKSNIYTELSKEAFIHLLNIGCTSDKPFDYHKFMGGTWFMVQDMKIISTDSHPSKFRWFTNPIYTTIEELRNLS